MSDENTLFNRIVAGGINPEKPVASIVRFDDPTVQPVPHIGMFINELPKPVSDAMANPDDFDTFILSHEPSGAHLTPLGTKGDKPRIEFGQQVVIVLDDRKVLLGQDELFLAEAEALVALRRGKLLQ